MTLDLVQVELSFLAGLVVYAMGHQAWLWFALRRLEHPEAPRLHPWTIGWGVATLFFLCGRLAQRTGATASDALVGVRLQYWSGAAFALLCVGLAHASANAPKRRLVHAALLVLAAGITFVIWSTDSVVTQEASLSTDLFGERYWTARTGGGTVILVVLFAACGGFAAWLVRRLPAPERSLQRAIFAIVAMGLVCGLNDVLFSMGVIRSVQLFHHACVLIALAITYVHVRLYAEVYATLSRTVSERTSLVEAQQSELERTLMAAERARRSAEALIQGSPDAILVVQTGTIVFANPAAAALLGHQGPSELLGRSALEFIDEGQRASVSAHLEGARGTVEEAHFVRRAGESVVGELRVLGIEFEGTPSLVVIVRDVTERRAIQSRLALADRMVSIGTLAAGVAHEINNPLTYVIASLESALEDLAEPRAPARNDEIREELVRARQGAARIVEIVRAVKTLSRADEDVESVVDVRPIVQDALDFARNEIRHRAEVVLDFEDAGMVCANPSRLAQVFLNLLVNAAHAIPPGAARSNEIRVRIRRDAADVVVAFSDTGLGMSDEVAARVFDPFFTTKQIGEGTGLGLSICHGIVTSMGGTIDVRTARGEGSTFTVRLPGAGSAGSRASGADEPALPPGEQEVTRILVIDDQPNVARAIARMLRGHDVSVVYSAAEGLARWEREDFDVVLCDLMMPEISGPQFYERCRARDPDSTARIVFMTGGVFGEGVRQFVDAIPNVTLEKPFEAAALRRAVAAIARARRARAGAG